jgi:hypothetical protein
MNRCYNCGALNAFDDEDCPKCGVLMTPKHLDRNYRPLVVRDSKRVILNNAKVIMTLKGGLKKQAELKNVSLKGICVEVNFFLEIDEIIDLIMKLPFIKKPIERQARVCWRRIITENSWRLGLDFGDNAIDLSRLLSK